MYLYLGVYLPLRIILVWNAKFKLQLNECELNGCEHVPFDVT